MVFCFFNPAKGAEEKKEERDLFRMGFEIEFPSYGISKKDQNSYVEKDPILQNNSNTWVLYRDTLDSRVEKAYFKSESPGIWNLEFKTLGDGISLDDSEKMLEAVHSVQSTVDILSQLPGFEQQFGSKTYKSALLPREDYWKDKNIKHIFSPKEELLLIKKDADYGIVRPQITYQMPLACLPYLFRHLYILGGKREIKDFFSKNENIGHIKNLHVVFPRPVDGLILLFDYYVYRFMCNIHSNTEPGPKPGFSVMSRISFRDMYRRLNEEEQSEFVGYVSKRYNAFECRGYDFMLLEDRIRPLEQAFEKTRKNLMEYKKEQEALTKKNEEFKAEEIDVAVDFYKQREKDAVALMDKHSNYVEKKKEVLQKLLNASLKTLVNIVYSTNNADEQSGELKMEVVSLSISKILESITRPDFKEEILIEDDEGNFVKHVKKSDWFSSPLPSLDLSYSMGVLDHPASKESLAVVEVRSYTSILGEISYKFMDSLIKAEKNYFDLVKHLYFNRATA